MNHTSTFGSGRGQTADSASFTSAPTAKPETAADLLQSIGGIQRDLEKHIVAIRERFGAALVNRPSRTHDGIKPIDGEAPLVGALKVIRNDLMVACEELGDIQGACQL